MGKFIPQLTISIYCKQISSHSHRLRNAVSNTHVRALVICNHSGTMATFVADPLIHHKNNYSTPLNFGAPIGRVRSRDAIVSLLSERLSAHSARFWQLTLKI